MRQVRWTALMLALVAILAGCGRETETSVRLGDGGSSGERSMTGDPNDTSGGDAPREPATTRPAPAQGSTTPASPGGGDGSQPNQGIAVGEPNPNDPDGCPECTTSSEPTDPSATPEPRPSDPSTQPRPGTDNPRPRQWESAEVHADDVTITITYWSGVEPCSVLDHVDVREEADRVVLTVYEGSQPGWDGACTAQAVQKRTDVRLSAPLKGRAIVDGAKT